MTPSKVNYRKSSVTCMIEKSPPKTAAIFAFRYQYREQIRYSSGSPMLYSG